MGITQDYYRDPFHHSLPVLSTRQLSNLGLSDSKVLLGVYRFFLLSGFKGSGVRDILGAIILIEDFGGMSYRKTLSMNFKD